MKKRTTVKQEVAYAPKEYLLNLLLFILFSRIPIYSSCDILTESIYSFTISLYLTNGEGNGNPLQYSCLENPMDEGAWWAVCGPWGRYGWGTTESLHFHFSLCCIGEGNGNPLQCSCLENPRDGEAWWASIYGVAQSRTWRKRLNSSSYLTKHSILMTKNNF